MLYTKPEATSSTTLKLKIYLSCVNFLEVTPPCGRETTCTLAIGNHDASVGAAFRHLYAVGVHVAGSGRISADTAPLATCKSSCSGNYRSDATVVLRAVPVAGWHFVHWTGDCDGTAPACSLATDDPADTTATFATGALPPVRFALPRREGAPSSRQVPTSQPSLKPDSRSGLERCLYRQRNVRDLRWRHPSDLSAPRSPHGWTPEPNDVRVEERCELTARDQLRDDVLGAVSERRHGNADDSCCPVCGALLVVGRRLQLVALPSRSPSKACVSLRSTPTLR